MAEQYIGKESVARTDANPGETAVNATVEHSGRKTFRRGALAVLVAAAAIATPGASQDTGKQEMPGISCKLQADPLSPKPTLEYTVGVEVSADGQGGVVPKSTYSVDYGDGHTGKGTLTVVKNHKYPHADAKYNVRAKVTGVRKGKKYSDRCSDTVELPFTGSNKHIPYHPKGN